MFLLWDWIDIHYNLGKKIRRTASWPKYKSYLEKIFNGGCNNFCNTTNEIDIKNHENFCKQLTSRIKSLKNTALEHCKLKENGCREYCEQYCDHFVDMGISEYYPKCPNKNQGINVSNELDPVDEEIENYLSTFVAGNNCLD